MKRSRFTEEQIIGILKEHQAELGADVGIADTVTTVKLNGCTVCDIYYLNDLCHEPSNLEYRSSKSARSIYPRPYGLLSVPDLKRAYLV